MNVSNFFISLMSCEPGMNLTWVNRLVSFNDRQTLNTKKCLHFNFLDFNELQLASSSTLDIYNNVQKSIVHPNEQNRKQKATYTYKSSNYLVPNLFTRTWVS